MRLPTTGAGDGAVPTGLNRRGFLGLMGAAGAAAALAACGGPATSSAGPAASSAPAIDYSGIKPAAKITFWTSNPGASQAVTQQIIDAWQQSQSDTTVELVTAGSNYEDIAQKFQAAQAGGTVPDLVVFSDVWWFRYFMLDSIVPMDSVIKAAGIDLSDYRDQFVADYQYKGSQWAIPWARSTPLFYYNKAHWSAAGLPDRAPKTWDEMNEWGPKLQAAGLGTQHAFQLPALSDYAGWSFQDNLWGWGGGWSRKDSFDVTCNSSQSVAALKFLQDAVYTNKWSGVASKDGTQDLSAGAVSATVASTGSLGGILKSAKFDVGAGFLPGGPQTSNPVCPTGGAGLGIPAKAPKENQLAAANFIKFLTSPENCVKFSAATGYIPIRKSANTSALISKTPQSKVAIDQLSVTRSQDWARVFLPGADQEMAKSCAAILTAQGDVQSTMDTLKTTLEGIYTKDVKPNI